MCTAVLIIWVQTGLDLGLHTLVTKANCADWLQRRLQVAPFPACCCACTWEIAWCTCCYGATSGTESQNRKYKHIDRPHDGVGACVGFTVSASSTANNQTTILRPIATRTEYLQLTDFWCFRCVLLPQGTE